MLHDFLNIVCRVPDLNTGSIFLRILHSLKCMPLSLFKLAYLSLHQHYSSTLPSCLPVNTDVQAKYGLHLLFAMEPSPIAQESSEFMVFIKLGRHVELFQFVH
jgi:hypothetical protein